mgnify:CR=1 FL=1
MNKIGVMVNYDYGVDLNEKFRKNTLKTIVPTRLYLDGLGE